MLPGLLKRSLMPAAFAAAAGAVAACGGGSAPGGVSPSAWPAPDRRAACYELRYAGDTRMTEFPRLLVIDRGGRSGRAFWFPASRTDTTWRDFYAQGRWSREGRGRVHVTFGARDVKVQLELEQQDAGTVVGRGTRRDSGSADTERAATLEGRHVSCPRPPTPEGAG
jgi:hypothetical protein